MKNLSLPDGENVPALGLGTWRMGESARSRGAEVAALRLALDIGYRHIDTAEMYGEGGAEEVVGEALRGASVRRESLFIVSKVYPHNASRRGVEAACERSLKRLQLEQIDLYLLHWAGEVPINETVEAFEALKRDGKIRHWGVSNLDLQQMKMLSSQPGGQAVQTDQVLYNLGQRGIEWDLLPWLRQHRIPVMAYSPFEHGRLLRSRALVAFARKHVMTPAQVAIAWLLAQDGVIAIPKTASAKRLEENAAVLERRLTQAQLRELDSLFPSPNGPSPLAMI